MSDIIKAREFLTVAKHCLQYAESLMTREPAVKKAAAKRVRITPAIDRKSVV